MHSIEPLEHSHRYAPSSLGRTERCTAPAILADAMPPLPPQQVTLDGVTAHHVMEACLKDGTDAFEFIGETFAQGDMECTVDAEMADKLQEDLDFLRGLLAVKGAGPMLVEARLNMPAFPRMFGTSDFVLYNHTSRVTTIADLKYGFVPVSPEDIQLADYGLMAILMEYGDTFLWSGDPGQRILTTVVLQPHTFGGPRIRSKDWTREEVQGIHARVFRIIRDVEERRVRWAAGPWCRYCHLAPACPKLAQIANDAAMSQVVKDPDIDLTGAELDDRLAMLPALKLYVARLEEMAQAYLEEGGKLSERKLVWKVARRAWADEEAAQKFLEDHGVHPWSEPGLLSPAQAEKKLTKPLKAEMAKLVEKKSSGLTTAPATDTRPAVNRQISDEAREQAKVAADLIHSGKVVQIAKGAKK